MKVFNLTSNGTRGAQVGEVFSVTSVAPPMVLPTDGGLMVVSPPAKVFGDVADVVVTLRAYGCQPDEPHPDLVPLLNASPTGAICFCVGKSPSGRWGWVILVKPIWKVPHGYTYHPTYVAGSVDATLDV